MKKIVRLTESDLVRLVKRVINEAEGGQDPRHVFYPEDAEKFVEPGNKDMGRFKDYVGLDFRPTTKKEDEPGIRGNEYLRLINVDGPEYTYKIIKSDSFSPFKKFGIGTELKFFNTRDSRYKKGQVKF